MRNRFEFFSSCVCDYCVDPVNLLQMLFFAKMPDIHQTSVLIYNYKAKGLC